MHLLADHGEPGDPLGVGQPWVEAELAEHHAEGRLTDLQVVTSPRRVTDAVDPEQVRALTDRGGWLYVSGHEEMGAAVDAQLANGVGRERLGRLHSELRYIVST